ncbi:MAG: bifunctional diaminohydroxyphosphoribosylaminopyrimidine deaminase/5-amino-6-(5-phosphoribosylamino)uracil reductase RibD [Bacteroidota bacterium]
MSKTLFMRRCFDLARMGAGKVSPNPMVGAVLVHQDRIIGEGFHQAYGGPHAEVNAVASVSEKDRHFIPKSTLYVSLEPCCIFGRTPPCTNLIIDQKIPKVIISTIDHTAEVAGHGIELLKKAGVEVEVGVLEDEGKALAAIRNTFVRQDRPYIILKYAQTKERILAPNPPKPYWITNKITKRLVHQWRSQIDAIMVGTNTAAIDNPQLNNRLYYGKSPIRIILDKDHKLSPDLHLFSGGTPTIVFTNRESLENKKNVTFLSIDWTKEVLPQVLHHLAQKRITSLIVEGGSKLLQSFVEANLWDEARVLEGPGSITNGLPAPQIEGQLIGQFQVGDDQIWWYKNS